MKIHSIVKPWGSSLGIVLPKEVVKTEGIKPMQEVIVDVTRKPDLRKIFGTMKLKRTAQELKDEFRKGWEPGH